MSETASKSEKREFQTEVRQLLHHLKRPHARVLVSIFEGEGLLHFGLSINQPPPCLTGFVPASEWRSPADTSIT